MGTVLVASVCLGIAVDDSIHFLFEYKNYRDLGFCPKSTVEKIMTTTFPALFDDNNSYLFRFWIVYFWKLYSECEVWSKCGYCSFYRS